MGPRRVTFLTLHFTGSNNGLAGTPEGDAEYVERNKANLAWLRQGFEHARVSNSRAIMIMQQANPFPEFPPFPGPPQNPSGFATDLEQFSEPIREPRRPGRCASLRATAGAPLTAR